MSDKKAALINISQAITEVSLITLAAVGSASGNIAVAGLTAVPAAMMTVGPTLARLKEKKEAVLELDAPKWWTSDGAIWKGLCNEIANHLPHILEEMATQLQKEQGVVTTQIVNQTFINAVANERLTWEYDPQRKREVATEIAPSVLQKVAEVLKVVIDPIRQDMKLVDVHNTAMNTAKMVELLEKVTSILEHVQKQGVLSRANNTPVIIDASGTITQVTPASAQNPSPNAYKLQQKIANDAYDVYICYDEVDETEVKEIGERLKSYGLLPWFDSLDDIEPGKPREPQQEEKIEKIPSATVFIGDHAIASGQALVMYSFIRQFVDRKLPVIPVLLQSAPQKPKLPPFLAGFGWVDFHKQAPDPMGRLIWGITGKRPGV
jgi:hypothetical protein